ncbi:MAG: DNA gyrase inhibitor YacG [Pseudomonadota bacterium]
MTSSNADASELGLNGARCPECRAPTIRQYAPFCSKRCADLDLHRWLSGAYAIPAGEAEDASSPDDEGGSGAR